MNSNAKITWPIVAVVAIAVGGLVGIFALIPGDMPEARTALLVAIGGLIGSVQLVVVGRIGSKIDETARKVDQVQTQTNGHMSTLLASTTQVGEGDVSRETGGDPS